MIFQRQISGLAWGSAAPREPPGRPRRRGPECGVVSPRLEREPGPVHWSACVAAHVVRRPRALRVAHWNTRCGPLAVYPSNAALPGRANCRTLEACMRTALGTQRWAPWWALAAVGAWFEASGSPRCPMVVMEAKAALAWRRSEGWGPAQLCREQQGIWAAAVDWARLPRYVAALQCPAPALRRERAALLAAADTAPSNAG